MKIFKSNILVLVLTFSWTVLAVLLAVTAYQNFLFWRLWWFDNVLHFISAVAVSLWFLFFYFSVARHNGRRIYPSWSEIVLASVTSIFVLGFVWELFEFSIDKYWSASVAVKQLALMEIGFGDSVFDLLYDLLGALGATLMFKYSFNSHDDSEYNKVHNGKQI